MSRPLLSALLLAGTAALFASQGVAQASTLTYDMTLTATSSNGTPESGTGTFTVDTPALNTSPYDTAGNGLISMTFQIDGQAFTLANANSAGVGFNDNGSAEVLNTIVYSGSIDNYTLDLTTSLTSYSFTDSPNYHLDTNGTLSVALAATPLPESWPLFASGFLVLLGLFAVGRRSRSVEDAAVLAVA